MFVKKKIFSKNKKIIATILALSICASAGYTGQANAGFSFKSIFSWFRQNTQTTKSKVMWGVGALAVVVVSATLYYFFRDSEEKLVREIKSHIRKNNNTTINSNTTLKNVSFENFTKKERLDVLSYACKKGYLQAVNLLLQYDSDIIDYVYKKDQFNPLIDPLHLACKNGHIEIVKVLVAKIKEKGADLDEKNYVNKSAIYLALENKHMEIAKILIDSGANHEKLVESYPYEDKPEVIKFFIENNIKIDFQSLFENACYVENLEIAQIALDNGASIDLVNSEGRKPLHYACQYHKLEVIKFLVEKGANVKELNKDRLSPLYLACCSSSERTKEIIQFLIDKGADINAKNQNTSTPSNTFLPISIALVNRFIETVMYLIELGAEIPEQEFTDENINKVLYDKNESQKNELKNFVQRKKLEKENKGKNIETTSTKVKRTKFCKIL